jgi:hypothetical protein
LSSNPSIAKNQKKTKEQTTTNCQTNKEKPQYENQKQVKETERIQQNFININYSVRDEEKQSYQRELSQILKL